MQDESAIPAEEAGEWLREHARDQPVTIDLRSPASPGSTLTIHRREWTEEESRRLAHILFGPMPDASDSR